MLNFTRTQKIEISHKTHQFLSRQTISLVINPHCKKERKLSQEHYCRFYGFRHKSVSLISRYLSADHQRPTHSLFSRSHQFTSRSAPIWVIELEEGEKREIEGDGERRERGREEDRERERERERENEIFEEDSNLPVKTRIVVV